jgi:hypothetical protein
MRGKNREYPFEVETDMSPKPNHVSHTKYGDFMAVPQRDGFGLTGRRLWAFQTEESRQLFIEDHTNAKPVIPPK